MLFRRNLWFILQIMSLGCSHEKQLQINGKYDFVSKYNIPIYSKDGDELPPPPPKKNVGFNFYSKDSCESNYKYYDLKSFDVDYYRTEFGRKTRYKIEGDSLKVFNRTMEKWDSYFILHLDENNLTLFDGAYVDSYAKKYQN